MEDAFEATVHRAVPLKPSETLISMTQFFLGNKLASFLDAKSIPPGNLANALEIVDIERIFLAWRQAVDACMRCCLW